MQFNCKYCQAPFEAEWWTPVDSDAEIPLVRFRRSLCDQCNVFAWADVISKFWLIQLPKRYAKADYLSEFNNRYDWSTIQPNWYYQELQYRKWGIPT